MVCIGWSAASQASVAMSAATRQRAKNAGILTEYAPS